MERIQMVDLHRQYLKIKDEIDASWKDIMSTCSFIQGNAVHEFSKNMESYLGVKNVIPCGNGTDALQASMMALGLKEGDEVITANFTFIATAEVIALLKLKPVVVDVLPDTFNLDPKAVLKAITKKTKAIVPVHLFGQCANMEELKVIANEYKLYLIEDACQSIGSEYIFSNGTKFKSGTIGDIGCTSFFPSKNLGCYGDGGAIFTNNDELAEKLRQIVNHGMKVRYHHDTVGMNSRLDSLQAAVLDIKLKYLDSYNNSRIKAADFYDKAFASCSWINTPLRASFSTHVFHQYTLLLNKSVDRGKFMEYLKENSIPNMIYYPIPLHLQKAYSDSRYKEGDFPVTEYLCKSVVSLPMHTELDNEQLEYIVNKVLNYFK